jgi:hypothetical protein
MVKSNALFLCFATIYGTILAFCAPMAVILTFYRNFVWLVNFVTLLGCYLIWLNGSWSFVIVVFWIKLLTNIILGLYIHIFHEDQYAFFQNLGFNKLQLYVFTFILDMTIWAAFSLLTTRLLL